MCICSSVICPFIQAELTVEHRLGVLKICDITFRIVNIFLYQFTKSWVIQLGLNTLWQLVCHTISTHETFSFCSRVLPKKNIFWLEQKTLLTYFYGSQNINLKLKLKPMKHKVRAKIWHNDPTIVESCQTCNVTSLHDPALVMLSNEALKISFIQLCANKNIVFFFLAHYWVFFAKWILVTFNKGTFICKAKVPLQQVKSLLAFSKSSPMFYVKKIQLKYQGA